MINQNKVSPQLINDLEREIGRISEYFDNKTSVIKNTKNPEEIVKLKDAVNAVFGTISYPFISPNILASEHRDNTGSSSLKFIRSYFKQLEELPENEKSPESFAEMLKTLMKNPHVFVAAKYYSPEEFKSFKSFFNEIKKLNDPKTISKLTEIEQEYLSQFIDGIKIILSTEVDKQNFSNVINGHFKKLSNTEISKKDLDNIIKIARAENPEIASAPSKNAKSK